MASVLTIPRPQVPRWYLAKYVADLRRAEPRNIGVVLFWGAQQVGAKFAGENRGVIPSFVVDRPMYRAWLDRWQYDLAHEDAERAVQRRPRPGDQFFMALAGERTIGEVEDPSVLLEQLFAELVNDSGSHEERTEVIARRVLRQAGIPLAKVEENWHFELPDNLIRFHFAIMGDEAPIAVVQRVTLTQTTANSWDQANLARIQFDLAHQHLPRVKPLAFVRGRAVDADLVKQVALLKAVAEVIRLEDEAHPVDRVRELVGRRA